MPVFSLPLEMYDHFLNDEMIDFKLTHQKLKGIKEEGGGHDSHRAF